MKAKFLGMVAASVASVIVFGSVHAFGITIETGNDIIASPTYFNGFEGYPGGTVFPPGPNVNTVSYSEGGITVSATGISYGTLEPVSGYTYWNGVGQFQWYAPIFGYTDIKLTGGGNFQSLQFLASSGVIGVTSNFIEYEVLESGSIIAAGTLKINAYCCAPGSGWETIGFSGGGFDEVRVQATGEVFADFNPTQGQGIALDNVAAISDVPLPAALPLFATGLGVLGLLGWRRKRKNTSRA